MVIAKRSALIAGATGLVGGELIRILLRSAEYEQVIALVRQPLPLQHPKLIQILVRFDELNDYHEAFEVNDVFCCLGTTIRKGGSQAAFRQVDYHYVLAAAQLAQAKGVQQFLTVTALGANNRSRIFYNRVKGEIEEALKQLQFDALYIFRPSLLLGQRQEFRFGEKLATWMSPLFSPFLLGKLTKYRPIQAHDVAQTMYNQALSKQQGVIVYEWDREN